MPYASTVRKSPIQGRGQFALRNMRASTVFAASLVPAPDHKNSHRVTEWASMLNHSNSPNTALIYNARDDTYYEM